MHVASRRDVSVGMCLWIDAGRRIVAVPSIANWLVDFPRYHRYEPGRQRQVQVLNPTGDCGEYASDAMGRWVRTMNSWFRLPPASTLAGGNGATISTHIHSVCVYRSADDRGH